MARRRPKIGIGTDGMPLALTRDQVKQVVTQATSHPRGYRLSPSFTSPRELIDSPLAHHPQLSSSLLVGLAVLISFPADGRERGVKEVAMELGRPIATVHRYTRTLTRAGLLVRNRETHKYHRNRSDER
jgi:hypothetical protein